MGIATLQDWSDQLAAMVEQVSRATARVDARNRIAGTGIVWSADGVVVTADHSTPVAHKAHSWHPVPGLVWAPGRVFRDSVATFSETTCIGGALGRMPLRFLMAEALAAAGKLAKFGA